MPCVVQSGQYKFVQNYAPRFRVVITRLERFVERATPGHTAWATFFRHFVKNGVAPAFRCQQMSEKTVIVSARLSAVLGIMRLPALLLELLSVLCRSYYSPTAPLSNDNSLMQKVIQSKPSACHVSRLQAPACTRADRRGPHSITPARAKLRPRRSQAPARAKGTNAPSVNRSTVERLWGTL